MTWAIHSIVYRDIGEEAEAARFFVMGYDTYVRGAFKTWHEGYGVFGGVSTFITGAGGWLQSVFAGYGGVRLARDGSLLIKNPLPPPNCTAMRLRQLSYLGNLLTLEIRRDGWSVELVAEEYGIGINSNTLPGLPVASLELKADDGTAPQKLTRNAKPTSFKVGTSATIRKAP